MLKPTVMLFTPTCNNLHIISFCLQLIEASFDFFSLGKKAGHKCLDQITIAFVLVSVLEFRGVSLGVLF